MSGKGQSFNTTDQSDAFKRVYGPLSDNLFNSANVLHGRIKRKKRKFVGGEFRFSNQLSFQGGIGSGSLPRASGKVYKQSVVTSKKVYGRASIEREAMMASKEDVGAFVKGMKSTTKGLMESYMRACSRINYGDGSGVLGRGDGSTDVTGAGTAASPYKVIISATKGAKLHGWVEANFEEKDLVQIVTGLAAAANTGGSSEGGETITNLLEVVEVKPDTREISLVGVSPVLAALVTATDPLTATTGLVLQRSYNKEPTGLLGVLSATDGESLYGIDIERRWRAALYEDAGNVSIEPQLLKSKVLDIDKKFGKTPKLLMTSYAQFQKLLNFLGEDQKRYMVKNRNMDSKKARFSYEGLSLMTSAGEVGIFYDRFCPDDRFYFINDNYWEILMRPGFGWFDEDGTIFLREQDEDSYEARYGGYWENYIVPSAHGCLYNLNTEV